MSELARLLPGFALNLVVAFTLIVLIYYPANHARKEYIFTFFSFNILIYFVSGLLRDVQLTIGFGFGLLAVFSTLRYRTARIPVKEMTYLFICITVPFMNTLFMSTRMTFQELIIVNVILVVAVFLVEKSWGVTYEGSKEIIYEKIELIKPDQYGALLDDLRTRTGIEIKRCEVNEIDYLRDTARLTIYYDVLNDHG